MCIKLRIGSKLMLNNFNIKKKNQYVDSHAHINYIIVRKINRLNKLHILEAGLKNSDNTCPSWKTKNLSIIMNEIYYK